MFPGHFYKLDVFEEKPKCMLHFLRAEFHRDKTIFFDGILATAFVFFSSANVSYSFGVISYKFFLLTLLRFPLVIVLC